MAEFSEDWAGHSLGVTTNIVGWTRRWYSSGSISFTIVEEPLAPGGKALRIAPLNNGNRGLSLDSVAGDPNITQFDAIALVRFNATLSSGTASYGGLVALGDGGASSATGVSAVLGSDANQVPDLRRRNVLNGSASLEAVSVAWVPEDLYWIRLTREGNNAVARLYPYNDPKGTPLGQVSQPIVSADNLNWIGLFVFSQQTNMDFLWFGVGTGADEALLPAGWGGEPEPEPEYAQFVRQYTQGQAQFVHQFLDELLSPV